jgi:hypothetical protein
MSLVCLHTLQGHNRTFRHIACKQPHRMHLFYVVVDIRKNQTVRFDTNLDAQQSPGSGNTSPLASQHSVTFDLTNESRVGLSTIDSNHSDEYYVNVRAVAANVATLTNYEPATPLRSIHNNAFAHSIKPHVNISLKPTASEDEYV